MIDTSAPVEPNRCGEAVGAACSGSAGCLFEAGMVDPARPHRREGGPATREARLGRGGAPEFRRTLAAYLDARATVLRPKTIDKLTSALADLRGVRLRPLP